MSESNAVRASSMFGDYDIIETVGQGGMGIVYRATDTNLNREVALKVLKDDLREHSAVVARFQREAEAIATLNHPNIVHIYTVGAVGKIPYIAMQMIHGMPLSKLMKKERRLPWKRALQIGIQVAEALGSAHAEHIIHRDIKPGNILIGADDHAFVTDFGIAKVLTAETQLTVEGSRLGTPQYMSPERCKNEDVTASSDLYSLGVLLFQMITGRLPYESKDPVELIKKIVSDPPHRMTDFLQDVPEDVERLIAFLIEKKSADRPSSADTWIGLCQRVLDGKPMLEDDSGLEESLRQFREAQATPTPTPAPIGAPYKKPKSEGAFDKLVKRLQSVSPNALTGIAAMGAAVVFGLFGFLIATAGKPDAAPAVVATLGNIETGWRADAPLARFRNETPGVSLIEIGNSGWSPEPAAVTEGGAVLVTLAGVSDTAWAGYHGVMWLDPEGQSARLAVTPIAIASLTHVGARSDHMAQIIDFGGQWYALSTDNPPLRESVYSVLGKFANEQFSEVTQVRWRDDEAIVATGGESGDIYVFAPGRETGPPVIANRGTIARLKLSGEEALLWSESADGESHALYLAESLSENADPLRLIDRLASAGSFDLHPDGTGLCAVRVNADGVSEAVTIDFGQPTLPRRVAGAVDARWHPSGNALLVLAPDRKDVLQVWNVESEEPFRSQQVTFLEEGVRSLGVVGNGRMIAAGGSPTRPALVEIDLSSLP